MKLKHAMWVMVIFDLIMAPSGDGVAHFAHLGGVVAGFIYMYFYEKGFRKLHNIRKPRRRESSADNRQDDSEAIEGEVFYVDEQKRMNEILDKVNREGIQSLNESERQFLLRAGDKLRRRRGGL
jgi:hypothetical protein